jgi:diguanylate cyclase (GGDEF)-like protein
MRSTTPPGAGEGDIVVASYRQLAEIYHDLLSRDEPDNVLERIVQTVRRLIPVASILVAEANVEERVLRPLIAEGGWPDGFMDSRLPFGEGLIGIAAERGRAIVSNEAHLDVRAGQVAGTPEDEPEAIISLPLVARGVVIGAMSLYREGHGATFSDFDFELAQRFADAATLALENARSRAELRELSRRDELTGVLNRRAFNEVLAASLAATGAEESVALVLVDLDEFKSVNDRHGHLAGDAVLREVAARLESCAGGHPVFRLGGDEFAVVVGGDAAATAEAVRRLETDLRQLELELPGGRIVQAASIGVASTNGERALPEDLLREADHAMYAAKPVDSNVRPLRLVARSAG